MQYSTSYFIFNYISLFAALLPLLTAAWYWQRIALVAKPFFYFFYFVVLHEALSYLMSRYSINTMWLNTTYFLAETIFFWLFLHQWVFNGKGLKWMLAGMLGFLVYWTYANFFIHGTFKSNSFARAIECLIIAFYAGMLLIRLTKQTELPLFIQPQFWIAAGAMIYFSFGVLVFTLYKVIADNHYQAYVFEPIWNVHSVINFISNLLYSTAFLCPGRTFRFLSRN